VGLRCARNAAAADAQAPGVRLPASIVRDEPNTAASGFVSGLIREPIAGRDYRCPVGEDARIPLLSVAACARLLVALGDLPDDALADYRTLNAPSIAPSAGEIAAAVRPHARGGIDFAPDPAIEAIICSWPQRMRSTRAEALGLTGDADIASVVAAYAATAA